MSMRRIVYQGMLRLPARVGGSAVSLAGLVGSIWPDRVKAVIGGSVSPDEIRLVGIALLVIGLVYFIALWLLKPGETEKAGVTADRRGFGNSSVNATGDFHGPVTI